MRSNLTGIWLSRYRYPSSSRAAELEGQHYVRIFRKGRFLIAESLPKINASYLLMRLALDDNVIAGSWQEETNPDGYYKGAIYHGAIQLLLDEARNRMHGQWVGFGKDKEVNVGPWELTYVGENLPDSISRKS